MSGPAAHAALAAACGLLGVATGAGVRRLSLWLARLEELESQRGGWREWGPPALAGVLFAAFGWVLGASPALLLAGLWGLVMVQVIFFDLEHRLVLDRVLLPCAIAAIALSVVTPHLGWKQALVAGLGAGLAFLLIALAGSLLLRAEVLGMGDVKLAAFLGLVLGLQGVLDALLFGIVLAGVVSLALVAVRVKSMRDTIAYGPYLALGAIAVLLGRGAG